MSVVFRNGGELRDNEKWHFNGYVLEVKYWIKLRNTSNVILNNNWLML